jgi:carbon monoxide dehydrogenase subunit G
MASFKSDKIVINQPAEDIFTFLSDFNNFEKLMPEQVTNWQASKEFCSFTIQGMADLAMEMGQQTEFTQITYQSKGEKPFAFDMTTGFNSVETNQTETQITLNADLNPMLKMMASRPLQNFVNLLVNKLKEVVE